MNKRIALFDSGFGGLSVLKCICARHSNFSAIYLADTARVPYGIKSPYEIRKIAFEIVKWMEFQKINAIIVACNTTNSLALDIIKDFSNVPVFDLIDTTLELTDLRRIGVLATSSTVLSKAYSNKIKSFNESALVIEEACPEFVPIVERREFKSNQIKDIASFHLERILKYDLEAIILGCSHFPLILPDFIELIPSHIRIIDPAVSLAIRLDNLLSRRDPLLDPSEKPFNIRFCVTSDPHKFSMGLSQWMSINPKVDIISLRSRSCVF